MSSIRRLRPVAAGLITAGMMTAGLALLAPVAARAQCEIPPHATWKSTIGFPDEPFAVEAWPHPRWVKFTILNCDPATVYFQNSHVFRFHYDFAAARIPAFEGMSRAEFDAATLHLDGQQAVLGAVLLPPSGLGGNTAEFGIQFVGADPYPPERVVELFSAVAASVGNEGAATGYYFPTFEQRASAAAHAEFLAANGVELGSADRWSQGNAIYSNGWALGRLRFVPAGEIRAAYDSGALRPEDILLTDGVPAEVPFVQGILSLAPATPNSHVAILARNYGVPFAHLALAEDADRARDLDGRTVIVSAFDRFLRSEFRLYDIEERLPPATVDEILALKEVPSLEIAPVTRAGVYSVPVAELSPEDIGRVGGKAANYGLLLDSVPATTRPAVAFTFDLWLDFLAQPLANGRTLREEIDARLAPHATYPPADVGALSNVLRAVRDLFEDETQTSFASELREAVLMALADPRYGFEPAERLRVRSSTNFEDSERFTGAGLFDSRSGCVLDDTDGDEAGPSHCEADEEDERGMFRAIRRVFASLYNDNAYLERLRWGVEESRVGMALLVHHSFPDETELANGVATLRVDPHAAVEIEMVTQVGATSVANPIDGSIPESVRVLLFEDGTRPGRPGSMSLELARESNLLPLGSTVLAWEDDYRGFAEQFHAVAQAFEAWSGAPSYTLDFEYKKIALDGAQPYELVVKQVRRIPAPESGTPVTPFFLHVPDTFATFQGEASDVLANHRLKSTWTLETRSLWLTEEDLAEGLFLDLAVEYSDGCDVFTFAGPVSSLPGVEEEWDGAERMARLRWRFDDLENPRRYEVAAGPFPAPVTSDANPFFTLGDVPVHVRVIHEHPVLGWTDFSRDPGAVTEESIRLAPAPRPASGDQPQTRSVSAGGVSITTRFRWPPPPQGIVAGYTAPLAGWTETVITGLTTEPIILSGDRSQTYRPLHHNFAEHFLFAPHEEEGISSAVLEELDARGVRWISARVGDFDAGVELYSACGLGLGCACPEPFFRRGDCNDDGAVDISDPTATLGALFLGERSPGCRDACDTNDDGAVDVSDVITTLEVLFLGTGPMPPPGATECGPDPTDDGTTCQTYLTTCR